MAILLQAIKPLAYKTTFIRKIKSVGDTPSL